ncbi:hypothetical protein GH5_02819 [Leishmania sp. Ghana 2012 LV757]|uniref:hypothetical protein n=1 Tax=Leishmania sp. Ghana 2012 LV757 TaxID=2803181 RepID=UPI001B4529EB|nr:hypothetical protein GH5_02819 [Leishmania sp. Ghana 2012 LV757]
MNFLLKSLDSCSCHGTGQSKAHQQLPLGIPAADSIANAKASAVDVCSKASVSNRTPARDIKDTGKAKGPAGSSGDPVKTPERHTRHTEGEASATSPDAAMTTAIAAEALLALLPQQQHGEEQVGLDTAEVGGASSEGAGRVADKCARECCSSNSDGAGTPESDSIVASTPSAPDLVAKVAPSGTPVAPHRSSNPTQTSAFSHSASATAWQMEEENKSRIPVKPTTKDNARSYKLSEASSSSPCPPRADLVVQRYTRRHPTGPMRGTAPVSPPGRVQHEVLMPISVVSKSKCDRSGDRSSMTYRTKVTNVSTALFTSRSEPAGTHEAAVANVVGSAASAAAVPTEASSLTMHSTGVTRKDLVSHVDRNSFRLVLWDMFQRIDFTDVQRELQRGVRESAAVQECRRLFRVVAKNKGSVGIEDLHELLAIFTPCGLSLREGADFLAENCRGKSSLTFRDFLQYGPVLHARLKDYELFEQLSDRQKLIATHARVLPGKLPKKINTARLQLLRVADQQMRGQLPRHARPLRLYEEMFLVDYQERLRDAELIPASAVPPQGLRSDYAHEYARQHRTKPFPALPQLSVPALLKEDMEWRRAEVVHSTDSEVNSASARADASEKSAAAGHSEEENGAVLQSSRSVSGTKGSGKTGKRKHLQRRHKMNAASLMGAGAAYGGSRRWVGLDPEKTEVVGQRQLCLQQQQMGRFLEEEYWERRTMDDHLITQLQSMYRRQ